MPVNQSVEDSWSEGVEILRRHASGDKKIWTDAWMMRELAATYADMMVERVPSHTEPEPTRYEPGFVYLLHAENNLFKIGKSSDPISRASRLGIVVPFRLSLVRVIFTDDMSSCERMLHRTFAHRHVKGEWFRLGFWDFLLFFRSESIVLLERTPDTGSELVCESIVNEFCLDATPHKNYDPEWVV